MILVIEDDPAATETLRADLGASGYEIAWARAEDAVARAEAVLPAAILLDLGLAGDGFRVIEDLRRLPATRAIPIVIQSTLPDKGRGLALGAADYFLKPLDRVALLARLRDLVEPPSTDRLPSVLLIDDDPRVATILRGIVEPAGFTLESAGTAAEGLERARAGRFDLAIVDIQLPDRSGFEVVEALGADEATRDLPVIVLTAADLSAAERERLKRSAVALAEKGDVSREALLATLDRATGRISARAQRRGPKVLVVDDHDLNRELIRRLLEKRGCRVSAAEDGAEAIEASRRERPALVFMDLSMPGVDGFQALRGMRADPRTAPIPVVALTALAMRGDEEHARAAGFDDYLMKPIDLRALDAVLARFLREAGRGSARPAAKAGKNRNGDDEEGGGNGGG